MTLRDFEVCQKQMQIHIIIQIDIIGMFIMNYDTLVNEFVSFWENKSTGVRYQGGAKAELEYHR